MNRRWITPALLALVLLWLLPYAGSSIYNNDEFTYLSHAKRMAAGQVPYRDFFEFIPPVTLWALAVPVKLLGASLATAHLEIFLVMALACLQLVGLARQLGMAAQWAWLPAALLACGLFPHWGVWSHHWLVVPLELGGLALAMRALETGRARDWAAAGLFAGASGMAVQSDGAALGLALGAGLLWDAWQRRTALRDVLARLVALGLGTAATVAACGLVLAAQGALGAAYEDVVRWPMRSYRQAGGFNDVRFGADFQEMLLPRTPAPGWHIRVFHVLVTYLLLPLAGLGTLAWGAMRREWSVERARFAMLGAWTLTSFWAVQHGRCDFVHLSLAAVPAALWLSVVAVHSRRWVPVGLLLAFVLSGMLGQAKAMSKEPWIWNQPLHPDRRLEESEIVRYLRAHARPGDTMAAMPYGGFFYIYGPPPGTRQTLVFPPELGYAGPDEFAAYFQELARTRPRFVVIAPWPFKPFDQAVAAFADHLPPGYRRVGAFASPQWGPFPAVVYERSDS